MCATEEIITEPGETNSELLELTIDAHKMVMVEFFNKLIAYREP